MLGQFLRRLIAVLPTLLVILAAVFLFLRVAPGGPFDAARPQPSPVERRLDAGYDRGALPTEQFAQFAQGLSRGDLGASMSNADKGVAEIVTEGAATTAILTFSALALALLAGGGLGLAAALRPKTVFDRGVAGATLVCICMSPLLLAPLLQRAVAVEWRWLPEMGLDRDTFSARALLLPIVALALPFIAWLAGQTRSNLAQVVQSDACRTARAKGMPERQVLVRHAAPVVALATLRQIGGVLTGICAGSLVVETVFQLPGIARALVIAAGQHDVTVVAGVALVYAVAVVSLAWLAESTARALDPRIHAA